MYLVKWSYYSNHLDINTGEVLINTNSVAFDKRSDANNMIDDLEKQNPDGAVFDIQLFKREPRIR